MFSPLMYTDRTTAQEIEEAGRQIAFGILFFVCSTLLAWALCYGTFRVRPWAYWLTIVVHGTVLLYQSAVWMLGYERVVNAYGAPTYGVFFFCLACIVLASLGLPFVRRGFGIGRRDGNAPPLR